MQQIIQELRFIENEFFQIDGDIVHIRLHYGSPDELFDSNAETKTPMLSDDFMEWLTEAFNYVNSKHKLDIEIELDDMGGYTEEELAIIFRKNMLLETKIHARQAKRENDLAVRLFCIGVLMILFSIGVSVLWKEAGTGKEIVSFILEVMATVPFWGAGEIYFVSNNERRQKLRNYTRRFHRITFRQRTAG